MLKSSNLMTRRAVCASLPAVAATARADEVDVKSFRYRIEALDRLLDRAKQSRRQQKLPFLTYKSLVGFLRDEELQIVGEVRAVQFNDITESNYWHRGRLKFPSLIQMELEAVQQGKDPATSRP